MHAARHAAGRAGALALLVLATTALPGSADQAAAPRAQLVALTSAESRALLDLYAADAAFAQAQTRLAAAQAAAQAAQRAVLDATLTLRVGQQNLGVARSALRDRLVAEYRGGGVDPLALLLGAQNLGQAINSFNLARRVAASDASLVSSVEGGVRADQRTRQRLQAEKAQLDAAAADATQQRDRLSAAVSQQASVVAGLRAQERSAQARIAQIEAAAAAAQQKAVQIQQQAQQQTAPAPSPGPPTTSTPTGGGSPPPPPPPPSGGGGPGSSLTVVATAYTLTGSTATGIPTRVGVCATDPSVIPLGTRFSVPGYGECVAADTGGAIVGNRIDVWLPTDAQASAWGLQTVTITIQ